MSAKKNAIGFISGRLLGLDNNSPKVLCLCSCGNTKLVNRKHLLSGKVKSCGCILKEINSSKAYSEDMTRLSIYQNMKSRCYNENVECYKHYGARGIKIEPEWDTFTKFLDNLPEGYSSDLELDRIDVDGNYCKANCRWTTRSVNCYNRRSDFGGVTYCKRDDLWRAKITKDLQSYQKYFKLKAEAEAWRLRMEIELFSENSPK